MRSWPQSFGTRSPAPLHCWLMTPTQPQRPDPSVEMGHPRSCCKHGVCTLRPCGVDWRDLSGPGRWPTWSSVLHGTLSAPLFLWPGEGTACGLRQLFWEPNTVAAALSLGFVTLQVPHITMRLVSSITRWGHALWDGQGPLFASLEATCLSHQRAVTWQASPNKQMQHETPQ